MGAPRLVLFETSDSTDADSFCAAQSGGTRPALEKIHARSLSRLKTADFRDDASEDKWRVP
jgi:hypothetical protein